jgi:hypothetical protein
MAVKASYKENDSVVILDSCDEEWEEMPYEPKQFDAHPSETNDARLKNVANTVFNLFKKVCVAFTILCGL